MLPQKFSAAATWTTPLLWADVTPPAAVEQAAAAIELAAMTAGQDLAIRWADDGCFRTPEPYNENRFHFKRQPACLSSPVLYRPGVMIGAWPVVRKEPFMTRKALAVSAAIVAAAMLGTGIEAALAGAPHRHGYEPVLK